MGIGKTLLNENCKRRKKFFICINEGLIETIITMARR